VTAGVDKLIDSLSAGLKPVRPSPPVDGTALLWLIASVGFVIGITAWFGPIRANALAQLASEPRFALETALGFFAIAVTSVIAFRTALPGGTQRRMVLAGIGLITLWLANYALGLAFPALEPSMLGKRDHCFSETLLFALPPVGLALLLSRRFYPLRPVHSASLFCLAAAMLPALYMQIACMYIPLHILQMHIAPALAVTLGGTACAWAWNRWRSTP
jgi:hypothetical protein